MKKVVMLFATGYEEVEALMTVDILRRAHVEVCMASVEGKEYVTSSHQVTVKMDADMKDVKWDEVDAVILPGGMPGTLGLRDSEEVLNVVRKFHDEKKIVAAICAAPSVLGAAGILEGKKATSYPGFEDELGCKEYSQEMVVVDENVVTSRGLGTAMEFAFQLVSMLVSQEKSDEIREQIVFLY